MYVYIYIYIYIYNMPDSRTAACCQSIKLVDANVVSRIVLHWKLLDSFGLKRRLRLAFALRP